MILSIFKHYSRRSYLVTPSLQTSLLHERRKKYSRNLVHRVYFAQLLYFPLTPTGKNLNIPIYASVTQDREKRENEIRKKTFSAEIKYRFGWSAGKLESKELPSSHSSEATS